MGVLAFLNAGDVANIATDDYMHDETTCQPDFSQPHVAPGEPHWLEAVFTVNGHTVTRRVHFTKQ